MPFTLMNVDFDCGLGNPLVAAAVALSALVFGAGVARLLVSERSSRAKAIRVAGVLLLAFMGTPLIHGLVLSAVAYRIAPGANVGCVIGAPPLYTGPLATLACGALMAVGLAAWRHVQRT